MRDLFVGLVGTMPTEGVALSGCPRPHIGILTPPRREVTLKGPTTIHSRGRDCVKGRHDRALQTCI